MISDHDFLTKVLGSSDEAASEMERWLARHMAREEGWKPAIWTQEFNLTSFHQPQLRGMLDRRKVGRGCTKTLRDVQWDRRQGGMGETYINLRLKWEVEMDERQWDCSTDHRPMLAWLLGDGEAAWTTNFAGERRPVLDRMVPAAPGEQPSGWDFDEEPHPMHKVATVTCPNDRKLRLLCAAFARLRGFWLRCDQPGIVSGTGFWEPRNRTLGLLEPAVRKSNWWQGRADPNEPQGAPLATVREWANQQQGDGLHSQMADLVREILGNPHRVASALPPEVIRWDGGAIPHMLEAIVRGDDFGALPVLSDALQDAGHGDERVLDHLRGVESCPECLDGGFPGRVRVARSREVDMVTKRGRKGATRKQEKHLPAIQAREVFQEWVECRRCKGSGKVPLRCNHARGCWAMDALAGLC